MKKTLLNTEEQLNLLKTRGVILEKKHVRKYNYYLNNFGYHNIINGYNDFFMVNNDRKTNKYKDGINLCMIIDLFNLDRLISSAILKHVLDFERKLSNIFFIELNRFILGSSSVSKNDKDDFYKYGLIFTNWEKYANHFFTNKKELNSIILNIEEHKIKNKKIMDKNFDGISEIPSWIINSQLEFGGLIKFIRICKPKLLTEIINQINPSIKDISKDIFIEILTILKDIRNRICHNNRLYKFEHKSPLINKIKHFYNINIPKPINSDYIRLWNVIKIIDLFNNTIQTKYNLETHLKNNITKDENNWCKSIPKSIFDLILEYWNF